MKNIYTFLIILFSLSIISFSCSKKDDNISLEDEAIYDNDGNIYNTVTIGSQIWLTENLKTTTFSNGVPIPTTYPYDEFWDRELQVGPYQWPIALNDSYVYLRGRYYTFAVTTGANVCPDGFHVPSQSEWQTLMDNATFDELKNGDFNLLGTGIRQASGGSQESWVDDDTGFARYWSSTSRSSSVAEFANFVFETQEADIPEIGASKNLGFAIRCIKD